MEKKQEGKYVLLNLLAIAFLATAGIWVRSIALPPISIGFYRMLFTLLILIPMVYKEIPRISSKDKVTIITGGIFLGLDIIFWNLSFLYTSIAVATLLVNLTFLTIVPVSYFLFREKITRGFLLSAIITVSGVALLMSGKLNGSRNNLTGDLLALGASVFYAAFLLIVYKARSRVSALSIIFLSSAGACITLFAAMLHRESLVIPSTPGLYIRLIAYAVVMQILGQGLMSWCLGKISASLTSVLTLAQPIMAAIYALILFNERLTPTELAGAAVVLLGIWLAKRSV